jgi:hypothetical protein
MTDYILVLARDEDPAQWKYRATSKDLAKLKQTQCYGAEFLPFLPKSQWGGTEQATLNLPPCLDALGQRQPAKIYALFER